MSQQNYIVETPSVISGAQLRPQVILHRKQAADIAVKTVNGTVTEIEKETGARKMAVQGGSSRNQQR